MWPATPLSTFAEFFAVKIQSQLFRTNTHPGPLKKTTFNFLIRILNFVEFHLWFVESVRSFRNIQLQTWSTTQSRQRSHRPVAAMESWNRSVLFFPTRPSRFAFLWMFYKLFGIYSSTKLHVHFVSVMQTRRSRSFSGELCMSIVDCAFLSMISPFRFSRGTRWWFVDRRAAVRRWRCSSFSAASRRLGWRDVAIRMLRLAVLTLILRMMRCVLWPRPWPFIPARFFVHREISLMVGFFRSASRLHGRFGNICERKWLARTCRWRSTIQCRALVVNTDHSFWLKVSVHRIGLFDGFIESDPLKGFTNTTPCHLDLDQ